MSTPAVTPARRAALDALRRIRTGALADRALSDATRRLDARDRAWTHELLYGVLRLRGRLDWVLATHVRGGLDRLQPDVLDVLRLGAYQLAEMDAVPAYAAVSQSVELARGAGVPAAAGLVNGVLQAVRRAGVPRQPPAELLRGDAADRLSAWESHPRWLVERWLARWGEEETSALIEADNLRPELFLRPVGIGTPEATARLAAAGLAAEPVPFAPESLRLVSGSIGAALDAVPAVVQDPAASLVVRYANVPEGATVLDPCAAPGGKAVALAERAPRVVAGDISWRRLARLRENAGRAAPPHRIAAVVADARQPPFRPADVVLLDAPCTGTGTLRRHPDGRWRITPADLDALTALQDEMLDALAPLVRPGGLLVYSTCSLEPEENDVRITEFLNRFPEFSPAPPAVEFADGLLGADGWLRVLPQRFGVDGAFAARLRRRA